MSLAQPVFFYGLMEGQDVPAEIDRRKTMVIRLQGHTELEEEWLGKVFFELNGQPRMVRIGRAGVTKQVTYLRRT